MLIAPTRSGQCCTRAMDPIALAEIGGCPEIDVHGYDVSGAVFEVSAFAARHLLRDDMAIKVIHGRGTGKLREALVRWAGQAGYRAEDSHLPHEMGAVLYVCHKTIASLRKL